MSCVVGMMEVYMVCGGYYGGASSEFYVVVVGEGKGLLCLKLDLSINSNVLTLFIYVIFLKKV